MSCSYSTQGVYTCKVKSDVQANELNNNYASVPTVVASKSVTVTVPAPASRLPAAPAPPLSPKAEKFTEEDNIEQFVLDEPTGQCNH
jgi:hypothetical protein